MFQYLSNLENVILQAANVHELHWRRVSNDGRHLNIDGNKYDRAFLDKSRILNFGT
jgi:hypothetical protein